MDDDRLRARAYWTVAPGRGEIRPERLAEPGPDQALVRTLVTGISPGTERLVHRGGVPAELAATMAAPHQGGELGGEVKYGYLAVGVVEEGPGPWVGRRVFALHPHQDRFVVDVAALCPVPDAVPSERALLVGALETALNSLWDAPPLVADRVAVVGAGLVGAAVAALLSRFPLERLQVIDTDPARSGVTEALGVALRTPEQADGGCDLVWHTSATEAGLATAMSLLGPEGELVELSWYGDAQPRVPLGGFFHPHRLVLRSSQVGMVSPARRGRRSHAERLAAAMALLADPRLDVLLGPATAFESLPETMTALAEGRLEPGCPVITYPDPSARADSSTSGGSCTP